MDRIRLLLLADTHIGIDTPTRPRVVRRRRGEDFLANFRRALEPALRGDVDLVVHGGDLLYRSKVPPRVVQDAMEPLFEVGDAGVPVFLVPGNHERSRIPDPSLAMHPRVWLFDRPTTHRLEVRGVRISLSGFPFTREVGLRFGAALGATGWDASPADLRLLCLHQSCCGARVGPTDFTFRAGPEVVGSGQVPRRFAAVLSGHIHRAQRLERDADGRSWPCPVIYPGSVERTSFAEAAEEKSYAILELEPSVEGGRVTALRRVPLPARPMVRLDLEAGCDPERWLRARLSALPPDAVVHVRAPIDAARSLTAERLRRIAPATMNIEVEGDFRAATEEGLWYP
jgi:exonuclease SbcD